MLLKRLSGRKSGQNHCTLMTDWAWLPLLSDQGPVIEAKVWATRERLSTKIKALPQV